MEASEAVKTVAFYGTSDDLIEVKGNVPGCDEYDSESAVFEIAGLTVQVAYAGCWAINVCQIDEDVPVTATYLHLSVQPRSDGTPGYSMRLDMNVPDGSYVTRCNGAV